METRSSFKTLVQKISASLKRLRSAFLKLPTWLKGGLIFSTALLVFNGLGALSYLSYRWQLESSHQIPLASDLLSLSQEALQHLQEAREQGQSYLARRKGSSLGAYQKALKNLNASLVHLKAKAAAPGPNQTYDTLAWLGQQLLRSNPSDTTRARGDRGIDLLGLRIESSRPAAERSRQWALARSKEEGMLADCQTLLQEIKNQQQQRLDAWTRKAADASRIFTLSIVMGNLLAFVVISLGAHSLMFHISLSESSSRALRDIQLFVDSAAEAIYGIDLQGNCLFCNRALLRLLGYERSGDLLGRDIHSMIFAPAPGAAVSEEARAIMQSTAEGSVEHNSDAVAWRADGRIVEIEYWSNPVYVDGQLYGAAVTLQDVTISRASRERLEQANLSLKAQVKDLAKHSEEMSAFSELTELLQASTSTHELCQVVTVFIQKLFRQESGALYVSKEPGQHFEPISSWGLAKGHARPIALEDCWSIRRAKPHFETQGSEGLFCAHLSEPLPDYSLCLPLIAQGGTLGMLHLYASSSDTGAVLSESKQLLAMALAQQVALGLSNLKLRDFLREDSIRDALTGLYNRRYMKESLDHELSRAQREQSSVGLIAFDLDHFKCVNDSRGHAAGDKLLHTLGKLVKDSVRGEDIACRYGGDEFVVILPGISPAEAGRLAELLRQKAQAMMHEMTHDLEHACTLSVGVALYPEHASDAESLQLAADRALYQAKESGRNCVVHARSKA